ncbi:MAG: hypothetical protein WCK35_13045 [Chloroflexota bacterium]
MVTASGCANGLGVAELLNFRRGVLMHDMDQMGIPDDLKNKAVMALSKSM